uniref:ZP domain-containing protein n=1 Tax=Myripristis murdjan TaxID=586833 RepID=A0A667ZRQ6_9TELE
MGKLGIFLYLVVGIFIPVQSTIEEQVKFSRDYVKNLLPFPIERNFDTIFSSWRSRTPAFHMLAELRPRLRAPRIQVFSTWTHTADSNIYQRGQIVYLQVTAKPAPDQQLFIQSCFVSASPDPQTRSRHAVILNKGCTATVGSQTFTQFVASEREGAINFLLDTSHLISEVYIHCSVLISDQGITSGSKSCNYNKIQSRWEELSGNVEVCRCCSSRCQGPSRKLVLSDTRAIVGTGPLVIVDPSSTPVANSMQSDTPDPTETENQSISQSDSAAPKDWIVSGSSFQGNDPSKAPWYTAPQGVVIMSQDPVVRLTLGLLGQVKVTDAGCNDSTGSPSDSDLRGQSQLSDTLSNDIPEMHPAATEQDFILKSAQRKQLGRGSRMLHADAPQESYGPVPAENTSDLKRHGSDDFGHERDELAQRQAQTLMYKEETTADFQPAIRSKLQFSKGVDGLQTLTYEEEVMRPREGKAMRRFGTNKVSRRQMTGQRGLLSTFLDLLRYPIFIQY